MRIAIRVVAAAAVFSSATFAAQAQQAVEWKVSDGGNGHWYQFVPNLTTSWSTARVASEATGGHLATLTSAQENAFVFNLVTQSSEGWSGGYGPFVGATRRGLPGWQWITGETFEFQPWGPDEPNNDSAGSGEEDRLAMLNHPSAPATWNDVTDSGCGGSACQNRTSSGWLTEWSADCNNDGIVDYGQIRDKSLFDGDSNGVPDCCELGYDCAQNLIQNGSFESDPAQPDCGWVIVGTTSSALAPWQVTQANVDRVRLSPMCGPVESWVSYLGEYTVDLDGDVPGGTISQTIQTEAGREYRLSLQLTANCGPGAIKAISVTAGNDSAQFSTTCQSGYPQPWRPVAMTFSATGTSTTVTIRSLSSSGRNGPVIDDVRVSTLEEPNACPGDVTGNSIVDGVDLAAILGAWGTDGQNQYDCDIDNDGVVGGTDLAYVLGGWGPCQ